jgi:hypothetical protein
MKFSPKIFKFMMIILNIFNFNFFLVSLYKNSSYHKIPFLLCINSNFSILKPNAYVKNIITPCCPLIKHLLNYIDALLGSILLDQRLITCQHFESNISLIKYLFILASDQLCEIGFHP